MRNKACGGFGACSEDDYFGSDGGVLRRFLSL